LEPNDLCGRFQAYPHRREESDVEVLLSFAWLALVSGLILRERQQYGLFQDIAVKALAPGNAPHVALIIPVRDEEHNIGACLKSLSAQDYPLDDFDVLVVDDHSSDRTVTIAAELAQHCSRLKVLLSPPLPPQWTGKCHACSIGARAVSPETEWLCFLDADVQTMPALLASAVAAAQADRLDLLSLSPQHQLIGFAERLVIPCWFHVLGACQDVRKFQPHDGDQVLATGQFMLIRNSSYQSVGGHGAVSGMVSEDVALARLIKRAGGRVALRNGRQLLAARMYTGWRTLWPGLVKNLVDVFGGPAATITSALAAIVLAWSACLVPLAIGLSCEQGAAAACLALVPASAGSAAMFGLHIAGASYLRLPLWYGLLFPFGYTIYAVMSVDGVRRKLSGRMNWKGRTYP
jgi:chlorobactene glucosyltransferase